MKFFETLLSGLKAIILSHSYSKAESDQRYGQNGRSDWNENDKSSYAYIKNRPFYEVTKKVVLVDSLTYEDYDNGNYPKLTFVIGQSYDVTWNGKLYEGLVCYDYHGWRVIADNSMGCPFYIDDDGGNDLYISSDNDDNWTVSITTVQSKVTKIPLKYLPEISSVGKEGHSECAEIFNDYSNNEASGSYSHAEGAITIASGAYSHAEGYQTTASSSYTHSEGYGTVASGDAAHAEGFVTNAAGDYSHAEGDYTIAEGNSSHAEGYQTKTYSQAQHVQGEYNIIDTEGNAWTRGRYAHIVGNGTGTNARSNAHTLDWSGNAWFAGRVYVGGTSQDDASELVTKEDVASLNSIGKFCVPINDSVTGKQYYLTMRNGQLVSQAMVTSIEITKLPDRLNYIEGEVLDPTGMVVVATYEDGTTEELPLAQWVNSVPITGVTTILSYEQGNNVVSTTFNPDIIPMEDALIDFEYTANADGTYTITAWRGTLNGVPSTEMVVPNSSLIYI